MNIKLLGTKRVGAGDEAYAQLTLDSPLPLAREDRFVLRDAGRVSTFGGGRILDPLPARARRNDANHLDLLRSLDGASPGKALLEIVRSRGAIDAAEARLRSGGSGEVDGVISLGPLFVSESHLSALTTEARSRLAEYHRASPLERGMPQEKLRIDLNLDPDSFEALLHRLDDVVVEGGLVRLSTHHVELNSAQQQERDRLVKLIENGGFSPPLAIELNGDSSVLRSLVESGVLVRIDTFFLTSNRAREARALVRSHIEQHGPATVAAIRDLLGTSRKYAVPLCEWLDQTGATRRRGDERVLGPNP